MPPLLCPSPEILDQSREREGDELQRIAVALGSIVETVSVGAAHVLLTPILREVVSGFARQPWKHHGLMLEVYRLLSYWFLQRHDALVELDVSSVTDYDAHAVPVGCTKGGLVPFWADELGRLLVIHDECGPSNGFSIGIACDRAFAGEPLGAFDGAHAGRVFPLVGPDQVKSVLLDAYEWEIDRNLIRKHISLRLARENCFALGATKVLPPERDSHFKFVFPGHPRNWTLSRNDDPVPVRYLRQLCDITGYPLGVVRHALLAGVLPGKRLRFDRYVC
jgi:hypothetical protein